MSFRNFGICVAITAVTLLSGFSTESASAHRRNHHDHHGHHGHDSGKKQCFHRHDGVRCFYTR